MLSTLFFVYGNKPIVWNVYIQQLDLSVQRLRFMYHIPNGCIKYSISLFFIPIKSNKTMHYNSEFNIYVIVVVIDQRLMVYRDGLFYIALESI